MANETLPVVLLVGGLGTRLGPEAEGRPKALVEIGGRPIVWHIMKLYAHHGHSEFCFPLGYRGDWFHRYFVEGEPLGPSTSARRGPAQQPASGHSNREAEWRLTMFDAGLATNKAARIRMAGERLDAPRFFATYGDGIGNIDIEALRAFHRGHGKLATLTGYQPLSQYGLLELDGDRITALHEKPRLTNWINAGFFVFERGALDYMQGGDDVDLERDTLARLAAANQLMIYRHAGFWASMDTFSEAKILNDLWQTDAPWKVWN